MNPLFITISILFFIVVYFTYKLGRAKLYDELQLFIHEHCDKMDNYTKECYIKQKLFYEKGVGIYAVGFIVVICVMAITPVSMHLQNYEVAKSYQQNNKLVIETSIDKFTVSTINEFEKYRNARIINVRETTYLCGWRTTDIISGR